MRRWIGPGLYIVGLLVVLELVFRVVFSSWTLFHLVKGWDDSSNRIEWVQQHQEPNPFIYTFDTYHPLRGWALIPNIHNMKIFGTKTLNSNNHGVRGITEYPYARELLSPTRRVLVFGDSYTFGDEVSDDETYAHFLGETMPDTEVLNMGVHGYGHDQMLVYLQEEGEKYRPDVVVLGFVALDMKRNLFEFNNYAKPVFDGESQAPSLVPSPDWFLSNERYRSKLLDAGVMLLEKIRWNLGWNEDRAQERTAAILTEFAKTVHLMGATPVFVYLPVLKELDNGASEKTADEAYLAQHCDALQVSCLFLRPAFIEAAKTGLTFNTKSHWFATEHAIAAREISTFLLGHR